MSFAVPAITPHHLQNHVKQVAKETAYDIRHHPRGHFIIMNNEFFVKKSDRDGSKYDIINLEKLATELETISVTKNVDSGFQLTNLKGADIKREIAALSKRDYSDHDVFVLCIMSHGANGVVYGVDGVKVDIETDICAPFDGSNCPTLSGKPKVFIIQACQGEAAVPGVPEADGDENDATPSAGLTEAFQNLRMGDTSGAMPIKFNQKIPHKSDMIIAYSTVKGYKSWRRPDLGSWFIRAIVTVFAENAHEEDLQSLFTMVKNKVSAEKTNYAAGDNYIQMPRTEDTFRKKLFFLPGYRENIGATDA